MESTSITSTLLQPSPFADSEEVSSVTATFVDATTDPNNTCSDTLSKEPPKAITVVSSSIMESTSMTSTLPQPSPFADSEEVTSVTATFVDATTDPNNTCSDTLSKEPPHSVTVLCSSDDYDKMDDKTDTLSLLISSETAPADDFAFNSLIMPIDSFLKSLENSIDLDINLVEMSSNDTPSLNTGEYSNDSILPVFNECLPSLDTSLVQPSTVSTLSVDEIPLPPVSDSCSNYLSPLVISIPLDKVTIPKSQPNSQPGSYTHFLPHSTSLIISIPKSVCHQTSDVTKRNDSVTKEKNLKISRDTLVTTAPNDDTKIKRASDTTGGSKNKYPAKRKNHLQAKVKKKLRKVWMFTLLI